MQAEGVSSVCSTNAVSAALPRNVLGGRLTPGSWGCAGRETTKYAPAYLPIFP